MTAAAGLVHEEFHGRDFARRGGPFEMVQLWVNLPAKDKMSPAHYQGIVSSDIPVVDLPDGGGKARVIAGELLGARGPARTFTPINIWDLRLTGDAALKLELPEGHTAMLVVLSGHVTLEDSHEVGAAEMVLLSREGEELALRANGDAMVLVLTGAPIDEPIVGHGPFVMNTEAEIHQAFDDFRAGRFVATVAA
jgi:redox-sensitive bicupin YhaK (pirin superfamily)